MTRGARSRRPSAAERHAYDALQAYTLTRGDGTFIHQHVVDAWAAQTADEHSKPMGLTFALLGLYLHLERGFTGRQVQRVHMALAQRPQTWPPVVLPGERGRVTAGDVMTAAAGEARDAAIDAWGQAVWGAYAGAGDNRRVVVEWLAERGVV